ncbi:MAG: winged helix-turn-helix domain-containing protein [Candidatus Omnitrophica bacterium]|nr:winged helix-turn-helix domain-containing protein [Candidatus Omnitrophota bacterium]
MKDKVIETAGKTWRFLGQNGETNVAWLPKILKEKEPVVFQALGWLAREDKINYTIKNRRNFVSLVEAELQAFNSYMYHMNSQVHNSAVSSSTNSRHRAKR